MKNAAKDATIVEARDKSPKAATCTAEWTGPRSASRGVWADG
jgi:hypothetical protein